MNAAALPGPLCRPEWLSDHLATPGLVVADVRWYLDGRSGRVAYEAGHIPGAVFVDLDRDLAAAPAFPGGRHPLPDPRRFAEAMRARGIGDHDGVVAYDDSGGSTAARLWWMLHATGHRACVLDGGLRAWPGALETGPERQRHPAHFSPRPWPADLLADAELIDELRARDDAVVLDARAPERYRGETEPVDRKAGHIPGARNAPWAGNLDPETGRFLAPASLRARYAAMGVRGAGELAVHCGSGVTACHDVLALAVAGFGPGRLYAGSWSDWSAQDRPVETGPDQAAT